MENWLFPKFHEHVPILAPAALEKLTHKGAQPEAFSGFITTTGKEFTVTVVAVVFTQLLISVPVIVYEVVAIGLAITESPVEPLKPVKGFQLYVTAPVAFNTVEFPTHIVPLVTVSMGKGFTVTDKADVFTQVLISVPVTV